MYGDKAKDALNARYSVRKTLGEYPPWYGYSVADSLSEREYLLFSIDTPPGVSLSIEDLRMRDYLFSRSEKLAPAIISLQQANGSITFLLPHADILPLANALPRMKPAAAAEVMRTIMSYVLARIGEGLCFCNLNLESFYMAHDEPGILPVAYLLPGDCLRRLPANTSGLINVPGAPFGDLRALGNVLSIFSPYLDDETAGRIKRLAVRLQSLAQETTAADLRSVLDELAGCAGEALSRGHFFPARPFGTVPPSAPVRAMKHAALKAREGEKQLVIVTGARGGGKTNFMEFIAHRLVSEWGFRDGRIAGDLALYQDPVERETGYSHDFIIVDDH